MRVRNVFNGVVAILVVYLLFVAVTNMLPRSSEQNLSTRFVSPSDEHVLGTDELGRDIASRIVTGTRYSIRLALFAAIPGVLFGVFLGFLAGVFRTADRFLSPLFAIVAAIPDLVFALFLAVLFGQSIQLILLCMGFVYVPFCALTVRIFTKKFMTETFVLHKLSLGLSLIRVSFVHVAPSLVSLVIAQGTLMFMSSLWIVAALGFLGVGIPADTPELGTMLRVSLKYVTVNPYPTLFVSLALFSIFIPLHFFSDFLNGKSLLNFGKYDSLAS